MGSGLKDLASLLTPCRHFGRQLRNDLRIEHGSLEGAPTLLECPTLGHRDQPGLDPALALGCAGKENSRQVIEADKVLRLLGHSQFRMAERVCRCSSLVHGCTCRSGMSQG